MSLVPDSVAEALALATPVQQTAAVDMRAAKRGLWFGRAYFFVYYGALVNFVAFINLHLQGLGISGAQIGIINAITCVVAMFAPPLFSAIADRWQLHKPVLVVAGFLVGVSALGFLGVRSFAGVLAVMMLVSIFRAPIPGIVDTTVIALANRAQTTYGVQRIWGGIGWTVCSFLTGQLVARVGTSSIFWMQFVLMGILSVIFALLLPVERSSEPVDYVAGMRRLTGLPAYRGILVLMFALGVGANAYVNFGAMHILAMGGTAALVGLTFTAATLTEIPSMFFADKWIYRAGLRSALLIGSLGYGLAWLIAAFAVQPWLVPVAVGFSGLFSGIIWSAMAPYTLQHAPAGLGTSALGIGGAAFGGAGFAFGALVGGFVFDAFGGSAIFATSFVVVMAGAAFFAWSTRAPDAQVP